MHRVVSSTDCDNRPAIGKVGGYVPEKNAYKISFTYSDDKEPKEHVDYCDRNWVEENLVDSETAAAWAEAVQKALSPITSPKEKESAVPAIGKRSRVSTSKYKPHDNTPQAKRRGKKKKTSVSRESVQETMDEGTKALLSHTVRDAVYDIRPHPDRPRLKPYMYWNPDKKRPASKCFLNAQWRYKGWLKREPMKKLLSPCTPHMSQVCPITNAQSMQKRQLKKLFLNHDSEYALITNYEVGSGSPTTGEQEMGISKSLTPEFETVQDLRKALCSPKMYTYPLLFDLFCAGLESGKLRSTKAMPLSRIEQIITVAHEAHFRLELWFSLRGGNYSHNSSNHSIGERRMKFGEICRFVNQDRHENADKAFADRRAAGPENENDSESDDSSNDGVGEDCY